MTKTYGIGLGIIALLLILGYVSQTVHASAPSGLQASVATTSLSLVGTSASTIFATSTCSARIITTYASPIMLTFSERQSIQPSGIFGRLQDASTTVSYDSGIYGCEAVQAFSFVSQNITVMETR